MSVSIADGIVAVAPKQIIAGTNVTTVETETSITINANGGQVFIEINFLEAVDYNNNTGKLEVNDKIMFWEYPPEIKKAIKGVSYQVLEVVSNFKGGKFTQDITAVINTFPSGTSSANKNALS